MTFSLRALSLLLLLSAPAAWAQGGNTVTIRFPGAPTGSCAPISYAVNNANGDFYDCVSGVWTKVGSAGGGGTPGGADTQVQFNDGGSFGGNAGLTFTKTNKLLTVTGGATTGASSIFTSTDTASNTGTGWLGNFSTAASSAISGVLINRGASGSGSRAWSVQDAAVEKAYVDFSGNASFASVAFGSLTLNGATSGSGILQCTAICGSPTWTLPATTGTIALTASPTFTGTTTTAAANLNGTVQIQDTLQTTSNGMVLRAIGGNSVTITSSANDINIGAARRVAITGAAIGAVTSCGTGSPSAAGNDNAFTVTVGTGTPASCTIAFSASWAAAPTCTANSEADLLAIKVAPSTTNVVISTTTPMTASSKVAVLCF